MQAKVLLLSIGLLPFCMRGESTVTTHIKKGPSLATRAVRPLLKAIHGITDDLRWILCLFAIGEFIMVRGNYDPYNSLWLRLWLATLATHWASKYIADEMTSS